MPPNTSDMMARGQLEAEVLADGKRAFIFPILQHTHSGQILEHKGKNYVFRSDGWRTDRELLGTTN